MRKALTEGEKELHNVARNAQVLQSYTRYDEWGFMCSSHATFLIDFYKMDCNEITKKDVYHLCSLSGNHFLVLSLVLQHVDVDTQTLQYLYHVYKENGEGKMNFQCKRGE